MELDRGEHDRLQAQRTTLTEQLTQRQGASREASDALVRGELQNQNLDTQVTTLKEGIGRMEAQLRELEGAWEKVATKRIVECALCVGV